MKLLTFSWVLFLFVALAPVAAKGQGGEYTILETSQSSSGKMTLRLIVDSEAGSYFSGRVGETEKDGSIRIKEDSGTFTVLSTEVSALSYMGKRGWKLAYVYQVEVLGRDIIRYIFERAEEEKKE